MCSENLHVDAKFKFKQWVILQSIAIFNNVIILPVLNLTKYFTPKPNFHDHLVSMYFNAIDRKTFI